MTVLRIVAAAIAMLGGTAVAEAKLDRLILGYSAVWRDEVTPPDQFDFGSMNYLARAFLAPKADGSITVPPGYFNPAMEAAARDHGVKLLLSLGGGGASAADWLHMATQLATLNTFLDNLEKLATEHHYDGIDVDWEPPDPTKADGEAYGLFLKALRGRFPKSTITTALPADKYQTRFTPWADVIANVDYVNVMAYDYSGPWSGVARHASNLFPAGDYEPTAGFSVEEGIRHLITDCHVPPAKLLLGMNFWAYRFRVDHLGDSFKKGDAAMDYLTYPQVQALVQAGPYQELWDAKAAMPYVLRTGGGTVICFENPESVRRKCEFARTVGCAGMMVWNVGSDVSGTQSPLMSAITQASGGLRVELSRGMLEAEVGELADELKKGGATVSDVPQQLSTLSLERLEMLYGQLRMRAAAANDEKWQHAAAKRG